MNTTGWTRSKHKRRHQFCNIETQELQCKNKVALPKEEKFWPNNSHSPLPSTACPRQSFLGTFSFWKWHGMAWFPSKVLFLKQIGWKKGKQGKNNNLKNQVPLKKEYVLTNRIGSGVKLNFEMDWSRDTNLLVGMKHPSVPVSWFLPALLADSPLLS